MDMTSVTNPFHIWAQLATGLHERFGGELGEAGRPSPAAGDLLSSLVMLARRCDEMGRRLAALREYDPSAYDAFLRALEKS